jgi:hypothetical protein
MKKNALIAGALFLFTAALNAQTDPVQPSRTTTDQWNNFNPEKYKQQSMPAALTTEKIFPVIGKYSLTDKNGVASDVSIALDETNKGIVWVDGLPQGRIKAYLKKAPGHYLIPAQKTAEQKELPNGVLIYDKDNNTLAICIGCTYNADDPVSAFTTPAESVSEELVAKGKKANTKAKPPVVKTWKYSGSKILETTASVSSIQ